MSGRGVVTRSPASGPLTRRGGSRDARRACLQITLDIIQAWVGGYDDKDYGRNSRDSEEEQEGRKERTRGIISHHSCVASRLSFAVVRLHVTLMRTIAHD